MDHHLTPTPPSPMENSAAEPSTKPPTPASTPNSRLASVPSSHHSATPSHASAPASASTPTGSRTVYSDRFIPSRAGSNLALFDLPSSSPSAAASSSHEGGGPAASSGSAASPYCTLLRAALFGPDTPDRVASSATACSSSSSPVPSPVGTPATGKIFRFKTEVRWSAKRALFPGEEDPDIFNTRGASPRKVPRSPYKVLDAPALQDDFYLNLVDWSSHKVLAVGLGNCVYLWNACSSKVTKLCDFGVDDNVCSVGWVQCVTQVAVGTYQGKVQFALHLEPPFCCSALIYKAGRGTSEALPPGHRFHSRLAIVNMGLPGCLPVLRVLDATRACAEDRNWMAAVFNTEL